MSGKLKIDVLQLGDSITATQNFVLKTNADGTAVLARGNDGATSQDILSIDASGRIVLGAVPAYADDTAASAGGLAVGGVYRIGNALQIRLV